MKVKKQKKKKKNAPTPYLLQREQALTNYISQYQLTKDTWRLRHTRPSPKLSDCLEKFDELEDFQRANGQIINKKKVREKSRKCHNHKPQPFPDPKRKRKPTNLNKHKPNKRTKSTKISSLFPKRGNRNTKRTEKQQNDTRKDIQQIAS